MQRDNAKLLEHFSCAPQDISLADISLDALPTHVSFIMDGNGRWAKRRGLARAYGHAAGVDALRETITTAVRLGLDTMSAYAFSTENWNRSSQEVNALMELFSKTLIKELPLFYQENVRLEIWGDLEALPPKTRETFEYGIEETKKHSGMVLALAVNYGSRAEIVRAAQKLAQKVAAQQISLDEITAQALADQLYSHDTGDPDLLIRTSGELRLSNYLLWQVAYTELYVCDTLWPDFDRWDFLRAIRAYQERDRRFGNVEA